MPIVLLLEMEEPPRLEGRSIEPKHLTAITVVPPLLPEISALEYALPVVDSVVHQMSESVSTL
jgi:hypothetical protein